MRLASEDMSIRGSKCGPGAGSRWLSSREPRRALRAFPLAPRPHRIATWKMAVWGGASVPQVLAQGGMALGIHQRQKAAV